MWLLSGWMTVVLLCCAASATAAGAEPPEVQLQEARTAFDEANTLWEAGQYADSLAKGERALALREAVLGDNHPDVARSLDQLGVHYQLQGNPVRAEPLLQRALAIQEAALGKNHPEVAQTLTHLASLYPPQGLYERAEPLYTRALAIREAAFGPDHPLVAESLHDLATLYALRKNRPAEQIEPLFLRALAIREMALGKDHPEVAQTLSGLADLYWHQGLPARAEPLFLRALAIREKAFGKSHPLIAYSLWNLVQFYTYQGERARAEPLYARALAIQEAAVGQNPPNLAESLCMLAGIYVQQGTFARAEPLYERALAVEEAALGQSHPLIADTLYRFALAYQGQGLYGRAEPLYERALAIWEAALGKNHRLVAQAVVGLGNLYLAQGLYARAEPLLLRALAIRRATLGEKSPFVALSLGSLGSLYAAQGMNARAEPLLQRALTLLEAAYGKNHGTLPKLLRKLGNLYLAQGQYARARPLLQRALSISEASFGGEDPDVADAVQDLAELYSAQGLYGRAGPLYERVLAIRSATAGSNHPRTAEALSHLAVVRLSQHRLDEALPLLTRAFTISEQRLRQEALGFSEVNMARFLQFLRNDEEQLYALLRAYPADARVKRLALSAALLIKGRTVEESADISRTVYQSLSAQDRDTLERLGGLRTQLAQLTLQGPGSLSASAYQQRLQELSAQGDSLEADLARRSAPLRALTSLPSPGEIVGRVAAALPRDAALIEFITYEDRPLVPRPGTLEPQRSGARRYLALVLLPDATIRFRDLGPAEPMDAAASRLRDVLANRDAAFLAPAQALYRLAFQPLLPLLGERHHLFLSPDGQLALVPFPALHDGQQFLVDTFDFTSLTSGKDLLPRPQVMPPSASVVVFADPDFSARLPSPGASTAKASAPSEGVASLERFFSVRSADLEQRAWAAVPLPGTRQEAAAIHRLFPQAQLFLGPEATKERLLHLPPPGILHLATHGFFLGDAPAPAASRSVVDFGAQDDDAQAASSTDPLLRSGLILAGARASAPASASPPPLDSALVTALELAGLNLWGTQLVVLSACDTGRGDVTPGQGVYGLYRAFLVAGAETVVMSLWKISDETTQTLMEGYYHNLAAGQGRASALREAMRALRATQPHPHDWAPFIVMGRDTPLRTEEPHPP